LNNHFTSTIIGWYLKNKRDLPWRETSDPYTIWLSEIILQQTRVNQGLPYFKKFIEKYPAIKDFSQAKEDEILKMWQGLGYYSRARNMIACANTIMTEYGGEFPDNYKELLNLKGIGKYTAAAIASICFNEPVPVVDGNVFRVLARHFGITDDLSHSKTFQVFYNKASELIDKHNPALFNQSMMEFGALQCTPKKYDCNSCVFSDSCFASLNKMQNALPIKSKKIKKKVRFFYYFIVKYKDSVLMRKRPKGDIWSGLYDFLLVEKKESTQDQEIFEHIGNLSQYQKYYSSHREYKHILTHQTIFARFYQININTKEEFEVIKNANLLINVETNSIKKYPVSILIDNFLKNDYF